MNGKIRKDRIAKYLIPKLEDEFLFDEFSDNYLNRCGLKDVLSGVPIPVKKTGIGDLSALNVAKNMAYVMGCDINFRYAESYTKYIKRVFKDGFVPYFLQQGVECAEKDDYEGACIFFRACIQIDPDNRDGFYCYGRACKDAYENGEEEEYVGRFKAESLEAFEHLTLMAKDFDKGFYFLGFGYLNLGLYIKAKLTWERFLELSADKDMREEIESLLDKLVEPCRIEEGYNAVISGRYQEGLDILEKYKTDRRFNSWWPLRYYIGIAYKEVGRNSDAKNMFLETLKLSPSNIDAMKELVDIYSSDGDEKNAEKYRNKIRIVEGNIELDRQDRDKLQKHNDEQGNDKPYDGEAENDNTDNGEACKEKPASLLS